MLRALELEAIHDSFPEPTNFKKIKEFHHRFGRSPDPRRPTVTSPESRHLRAVLIFEEMQELFDELGVRLMVENDTFKLEMNTNHPIDLSNVAKETADLLYVVYGTAASMGLPIDEVYSAVHTSNMSKLGDDGQPLRRGDGKVLKGPNYQPPIIDVILKGNQNR